MWSFPADHIHSSSPLYSPATLPLTKSDSILQGTPGAVHLSPIPSLAILHHLILAAHQCQGQGTTQISRHRGTKTAKSHPVQRQPDPTCQAAQPFPKQLTHLLIVPGPGLMLRHRGAPWALGCLRWVQSSEHRLKAHRCHLRAVRSYTHFLPSQYPRLSRKKQVLRVNVAGTVPGTSLAL